MFILETEIDKKFKISVSFYRKKNGFVDELIPLVKRVPLKSITRK